MLTISCQFPLICYITRLYYLEIQMFSKIPVCLLWHPILFCSALICLQTEHRCQELTCNSHETTFTDIWPYITHRNTILPCKQTALQSQTTASAFFTSKQILHFGFAELQMCGPISRNLCVPSGCLSIPAKGSFHPLISADGHRWGRRRWN